MYTKDVAADYPALSESTSFVTEDIWHPLSYYISGGIDLDGSHTRLDATPEYDGERDDSPDVFSSSEVLGQPLYDPRFSPFDMAETIGVSSYREAVDALKAPAHSGSGPSGPDASGSNSSGSNS